MKIERISHNKIKVTLSIDDLEEWNIDIENLSYNSPETQEMFWNMMKKAELEAGFYVDDSQLIIEAMPLQSEGFVIIVTRVDEDDDFESIHKYIKSKFKKSELRVKRKNKKICSGLMIYMFSDFDDICSASTRLLNIYAGESTLYRYKDYYYLALTRNCTLNSLPETVETILTEYGHKIPHASIQEGFLNEHGSKIIENNALEVLQQYFST
ncbi:adaptor protein MecA [Petroclostridium sp. X23]|uniref:adaptor protein MecA n=1 Tax=Petroclostridium sp. X23 TaxID=3045146 RepID=UPI0024AD0EC3|nr:adaptor protein MecA [Petroclostridium sp. X23]WHH61046.1 adaptor protein MecA [Petroclostridium sp. X23]